MYRCVLPEAYKFIRESSSPLIDEEACDMLGKHLEEKSMDNLKHYPLDAVVFYTQIPHIRHQVMSRMFQFLLADMGLKFTTSDYPALIDSELGATW